MIDSSCSQQLSLVRFDSFDQLLANTVEDIKSNDNRWFDHTLLSPPVSNRGNLGIMSTDEFGRVVKHPHHSGDAGGQNGGRPVAYEDGRHDDRGHNRSGHYGPGEMQGLDKRGVYPGLVVKGEVVRVEPYGAFVEFVDQETGRRQRGLAHISQLASRRVERVEDVLKLKDQVYAVILSIEQDRQHQRIRLSLVDVDQDTGKYSGPDLEKQQYSDRRGRSGRSGGSRQRMERAKERRRMYMSFLADWRKGSEALNDNSNAPAYLRTLWSASPEPPKNEVAKKDTEKRKHDEPSTEASSSESESSSSTDYRRRRKDRKRSRSSRHRSQKSRDRRSSRRSRKRRRKYSSSSESSTESSSKSSSDDSSRSSDSKNSNEDPKEKVNEAIESIGADDNWKDSDVKNAQDLKAAVHPQGASSDEDEGPMPLPQSNAAGGTAPKGNATYGKALLPGEGQAIAQYVQQNVRIPRRGEIGYSGEDIDQYESSGYVMSGSRHKRMNAVRIRKENQVYSAEEQRALALITAEENQQKEAQLMEDFRIMLKEKQRLRNEKGK
eukprot:scaffold2551_cov113-Cylindrotheca_fusiformis.AAC.2